MLTFIDEKDQLAGYDNSRYLGREVKGSEFAHTSWNDSRRTHALRRFNLPNARAPEDWPMVHGALEARVERFERQYVGGCL